mmetsp:Transcript_4502/g.11325  ORF Transcript_4502/g.11325 Transcript_4502/m.11325 type:complete len:232 (-) Transcript_4502:614-1309(-)
MFVIVIILMKSVVTTSIIVIIPRIIVVPGICIISSIRSIVGSVRIVINRVKSDFVVLLSQPICFSCYRHFFRDIFSLKRRIVSTSNQKVIHRCFTPEHPVVCHSIWITIKLVTCCFLFAAGSFRSCFFFRYLSFLMLLLLSFSFLFGLLVFLLKTTVVDNFFFLLLHFFGFCQFFDNVFSYFQLFLLLFISHTIDTTNIKMICILVGLLFLDLFRLCCCHFFLLWRWWTVV